MCAVSYDVVAGAAKRLRDDPRVISLEPASLEDIFGTIETVAQICGVPERATALLAHLRSRVAELRTTTSTLTRPRTLLLEWPDPPMNAGHWIPDIIELAGGDPVLASAGRNSQRLEWNAITEADPDVVLVAPCGYNLETAKAAIRELDAYPAWRTLRAVREKRLFAIDGNAYVSRPGPRLVESAELLARALHGATIVSGLSGMQSRAFSRRGAAPNGDGSSARENTPSKR